MLHKKAFPTKFIVLTIALFVMLVFIFSTFIFAEGESFADIQNNPLNVLDFEIDGNEVRSLSQDEKNEVIQRREVCLKAEADITYCYGKSASVDTATVAAIEDDNILSIKVESIDEEHSIEYKIKYRTNVDLLGFVKYEVVAYAVLRNYPDPAQTEKYTEYDVPWYINLFIWKAPQEGYYINLAQDISRG